MAATRIRNVCRQRIARGGIYRSRGRLPRTLAIRRWLGRLCERTPCSTGQRVGDTLRRRAYYVAAMALHAAEDKTFQRRQRRRLRNALGRLHEWRQPQRRLPSGVGSRPVSAGHGLDRRGRLRAGLYAWRSSCGRASTSVPLPPAGTTYPPGAFPRYSPVSGSSGAIGTATRMLRAVGRGSFRDSARLDDGPDRQWHVPENQDDGEPLPGGGPRHDGALGGTVRLVAVVDRGGESPVSSRRQTSPARTAMPRAPTVGKRRPIRGGRALLGWTFTTAGYWGGHQYYERIDKTSNPNDGRPRSCFDEGCFYAHDIVDFGFLDLVRLGERCPTTPTCRLRSRPRASAFDGNSAVQVTMPQATSIFTVTTTTTTARATRDCKGWPANGPNRYGRLWPVLSGERGEYELANGRSASVYLQSMADAANDGYFVPEQIWDRSDIPVSC
jgi:glucoamylase